MDDVRLEGSALTLRLVERALGSVVDGLEPDEVAPADVTDMWVAFDRVERRALGAKVLLAARVEASGSWKRAGARSAAEFLATLGGTSVGAARRSLTTSKQLARLAGFRAAVRAGVLSGEQVAVIAPAAAAEPGAQSRLVGLAGSTNVRELREECVRVRVGADPDPDATHARIHRERRAGSRVDGEGAWIFSARGTAECGARFEAALEPVIDDLFARARAEGRKEPRSAYAFDALMTLGRGPTAAQRIALLWMHPKCANEVCSRTFVQIDHRIPWATTQHTRLDELDPLCPHHHRLKTHQGWALVHGNGRRAFVGPKDRRHPRYGAPP